MQFIIPKFVLNEIEMPTRVINEHENYFWLEAVERLKGFLLTHQLPFIVLKDTSQPCYGYDEAYIYNYDRFPRLYNEWAIEQTERYPKGKLLRLL